MSQYVNFCYQPEIYISRILPECADVNFIGSVINNYGLGHVSSIDLTMTNNEINGQPLYYAVVKFHFWNIDNTIDYRTTLMQGKFVKMYYSNYNFWKVSEYKTPQKMPMYPMPGVMVGNGMTLAPRLVPPQLPPLKRQACVEFSEFDKFYRRMQMVEHWSKIDKDADILDFGCKYEEMPTNADTHKDDDISELSWNETDENLLEEVLFKKMKAADDAAAAAAKPEFKFHNGYRMFNFDYYYH